MTTSRTIFRVPSRRKKATEAVKPYIAGLLDAKAKLMIVPKTVKGEVALMTLIRLDSKNLDMLRFVQEGYGGCIICARKNKDRRTGSIYRLEIVNQKDIVNLMKDTSRYLIAKRKHADLLLRYCLSRLKAAACAESSFLAVITEDEKSIAKELMKLNRNEG